MRNQPITRVEAGTACKIIVNCSGSLHSPVSISIPGIENVTVNSREQAISMTPAGTMYAYIFHVYINTVGTYTFGPVSAEYNGMHLESNTKTVEAVAPSAIDYQSIKSSATTKEDAFVVLTVDKKEPFVGEKIVISLEFYSKDPAAEPLQALMPPLPHAFELQEPVSCETYQESIKGVTYTCHRWQCKVRPRAIEEVVLPACSISYKEPDKQGVMHPFSLFFGPLAAKKTVHSRPLFIKVKGLPPHQGTVDGIGEFNSLKLEVKQLPARVGQACLAQVHLTGKKEDIQALTKTPALLNVPPEITYYDSQVTTQILDDAQAIKTFEYILQPLKAGSVTIGEQKYTFFDSRRSKYVTLTAKPYSFEVAEPDQQQQEPASTSLANLITDRVHLGDISVLEDREPSAASSSYIPWPWFFMLLCIPFLTASVIITRRHIAGAWEYAIGKKTYKNAFSIAHQQLNRAEKKNARADVYVIFMELFSVRLAKNKQQITDALIEELFERSPHMCHQRQAWNIFWHECTTYAFVTHEAQQHADFWQQSHEWITVLERLL